MNDAGKSKKLAIKQPFDGMPLVSVITVVFNDKKSIERTIQSVINQSYDNIQYIVIDGNSTDGTIESIKKYDNQIDYWLSEPDKGLYDAMNKGVALSNGYIIMLNSGDTFYNNKTIYNVSNYLISKDVVYYGNVWNYNNYIGYITPQGPVSKNNNNIPCHNGTFIHADIHKKYLYPLEYPIGADAYVLHQLKNAYKMFSMDLNIQKLCLGGISNSMSNFWNVYSYYIEDRKINKEYYSGLSIATSIYLTLALFFKYLFRKVLSDKYFYRLFYRKFLLEK